MYKIIGADQKEYGPVSMEEMRRWIAEGRVNAQTLIQAEGQTDWRPLSAFPELAGFAPAAPAAPFPTASPVAVQSMVSGPAISIMVLGILFAILSIVGVIANLMGVTFGQFGGGQRGEMPPELQQMLENLSGPVGAAFGFVQLLLSGFIIFASLKYKKLESYGLAMTASILCMLPCVTPSCCCIIGLPIGIWSIIVLSKPEVKAAFH